MRATNTNKEFSKFIKRIRPFITSDDALASYSICQRFFELVLGYDSNKKKDDNHPVHRYVLNNFDDEKARKIFQGTDAIPSINCDYFLSNLDSSTFKEVYDGLPTIAKQNLVTAMTYYFGDVTEENCYIKILEIFELILKKFKVNSSIQIPVFDPYPEEIDPNIVSVIANISNSLYEIEDIGLLYSPKHIKEKVKDVLLCRKIKANISYNFYTLNEILSLCDEDERISKAIKNIYLKEIKELEQKEKNKRLPKDKKINDADKEEQIRINHVNTFEKLVLWVMAKGSCSREASEMIVSYYIQKCEVF